MNLVDDECVAQLYCTNGSWWWYGIEIRNSGKRKEKRKKIEGVGRPYIKHSVFVTQVTGNRMT